MKRTTGKGYYMISAVAAKYNIHPQTLRLYEREGLLKPSRTDGNTRLYSDEDLQELETILALTRDLGVNLAGVEIILNMRRKMERMQHEVNEFMEYVKRELARGLGDWEQRLNTALVPTSPASMKSSSSTAAIDDAGGGQGRARSQARRPDRSLRRVRRSGCYSVDRPMACATCEGTGWRVDDGRWRASCRALHVLADRTRLATGRGRAHSAALPRCDLENFLVYPNEQLHQRARARASLRRRVSGRAEGPLPDRPAGHRQDAHRRVACCAGSSSRRARAACSTTCAICCASFARPTTPWSVPPRWTSSGP